MRITCPECSAAYEVPPERVPPGRGVRCARCGGTWTPVALVDAAPAVVVVEEVPAPLAEAAPRVAEALVVAVMAPASEPVEARVPEPVAPQPPAEEWAPEPAMPGAEPLVATLVAQQPRRRRGVPVWIGWAVSAAVLAGLGWGLVTQRAEVVRQWPPSERAYALLGLAP